MIRDLIVAQIVKTLESNSTFISDDFRITHIMENDFPGLAIEYRYDSSKYYKLYYKGSGFEALYSPGEYTINEKNSGSMTNLYTVQSSIKDWVGRVHQEVMAAPLARLITMQNDQLDEFKKKLQGLNKDSFSPDEEEKINTLLDKMKEEIQDKLSQSILDKKTLEDEITKLKNDIELLKAMVPTMKPGNWAEMLFVRLNRWKPYIKIASITAKTLRLLSCDIPTEGLETFSDAADGLADAANPDE